MSDAVLDENRMGERNERGRDGARRFGWSFDLETASLDRAMSLPACR
jgi:hypothetical protein